MSPPRPPRPTIESFFSAPSHSVVGFDVPARAAPAIFTRKTISQLAGGEVGLELAGVCVGAYRPPTNHDRPSADPVTLWLKDESGVVALHVEGRQIGLAESVLGHLVAVTDPVVRLAQRRGPSSGKQVIPLLSRFVLEVRDTRGKIAVIDEGPGTIDRKYLAPLALDSMIPVSLRDIVAGKTSERVFVQVLAVGEVKRIGKGIPQRPVTVSDGELVLTLCLWRNQAEAASTWKRLATILLLTNPKVSVFGGNIQLSLGYQSLIEVIEGKEAELLRSYSRMISQETTPPASEIEQLQSPVRSQPQIAPPTTTSSPLSKPNPLSNLGPHATIQDLQSILSSPNPRIQTGHTIAILAVAAPDDEQPYIRLMDETGQWTVPYPSEAQGAKKMMLWARHIVTWRLVRKGNEGQIELCGIERATAIMGHLCEIAACSI